MRAARLPRTSRPQQVRRHPAGAKRQLRGRAVPRQERQRRTEGRAMTPPAGLQPLRVDVAPDEEECLPPVLGRTEVEFGSALAVPRLLCRLRQPLQALGKRRPRRPPAISVARLDELQRSPASRRGRLSRNRQRSPSAGAGRRNPRRRKTASSSFCRRRFCGSQPAALSLLRTASSMARTASSAAARRASSRERRTSVVVKPVPGSKVG